MSKRQASKVARLGRGADLLVGMERILKDRGIRLWRWVWPHTFVRKQDWDWHDRRSAIVMLRCTRWARPE